MTESIFFNAYPRQWRLILRGLVFFSLLLALVFFALSIRLGIGGEDGLPTYLFFIAFLPGYCAQLLRSAVSTDSPDADDSAFAWSILICAFTLLITWSIYFDHSNSIKQQARAQWSVSQACTQDGEIRTDFKTECLRLMTQAYARPQICLFGATPMATCEVELREKLNRPVGWEQRHFSQDAT
ncbi:MAG: hypothetical protein AAGL99_01475 [Pseudomonadota bacterium]